MSSTAMEQGLQSLEKRIARLWVACLGSILGAIVCFFTGPLQRMSADKAQPNQSVKF